MEFTLDCKTFVRLSKIAQTVTRTDSYFRSIWLEIKNGKAIAVSANIKIAAIELIGEDLGPDGFMNVCIDEPLIKQCETESAFGGKITFQLNSILNYATAKTTLGYIHPTNAFVTPAKDNEFSRWRKWLPDKIPKTSTGAIFANLNNLSVLASAAPSGSIVFQEKIDTTEPIIIGDVHDPNWIGVFMPRPDDLSKIPGPLQLPKWVK